MLVRRWRATNEEPPRRLQQEPRGGGHVGWKPSSVGNPLASVAEVSNLRANRVRLHVEQQSPHGVARDSGVGRLTLGICEQVALPVLPQCIGVEPIGKHDDARIEVP